MRIGIVSDAMLFQREHALQVQLRETLRALAALRPCRNGALSIVPFDGEPAALARCDALHVFSAGGPGRRATAMAAAMRVPLVFSPLASPARAVISPCWTRSRRRR